MKKGTEKKQKYHWVKTPTEFQLEAAECGAACLSMILQYYGKYIPQEKLREMVGVSRDGSKAGNIMRTGQALGMEVHGYRRETDQLLQMKPPCVIHWEFNHFVVFEGVHNKKIMLNDPAMGQRRLTYEEFNDSFTGIVITFTPTEKFVKEKKKNPLGDMAMRSVRENRGSFLALFLIGILLVLPGFVISAISGTFIDRILRQSKPELVLTILILMAALLIFQIFFQMLNNWLLIRLQKKISLMSAQNMLYSMFRLPMRFFDLRFTGDLSTRLNHNIQIAHFLSQTLVSTAISVVESVFYFILLLMINWIMAIVVLAGLFFQMIIIRRCSQSLRELSMRQNREIGRTVGILTAGLSISDSLKTAGAEGYFLARLLGSYTKVANSQQKTGVRQQVLNALPRGIGMLVQVTLLLIGGIMVINGTGTQGSMVAFITLYAQFLIPVQTVSSFISELNMIRADSNYIQDITKAAKENKYSKDVKITENIRLNGTLEAKELTFGYNTQSVPLIRNFSLSVPAGHSAALVGLSGSGKSTVIKLLNGLLEPWEGNIYLDSVDVNVISNEVIHLNMAAVSQTIHLFQGSIRDNLTLWNPAIPEESLIRAAKDACIYDTILSKEGGFNYQITEEGNGFSGGEKQRLEIARALVTDPAVLFLDEATSALDPVTEANIMKNIENRGCTLIISAHRLSTIRNCDEIIVLEDGRPVARGTHTELLDTSEHYRKLVKES